MAFDAPTFRKYCPQLHEFNGLVHRQFSDPAALSKLHGWMSQFLADQVAAEEKERDRQNQRRRYFLIEVFKPGNERLRDHTRPVWKHLWSHYDSQKDRQFCDVYPHGLPDEVKNGTVKTWKPKPQDPVHLMRTVVPCFNPHNGAVVVSAWTPLELNSPDLGWKVNPQAPLPPKRIDRPYTIPEISRGIAALHDADESYEPFVPAGHPLDTSEWRLEVGALKLRNRPRVEDRLTACDLWLLILEPLWKQLVTELESSGA
jgi:hypothetical protein